MMTEEEKLRRSEELRRIWNAEKKKREEMTPEELAEYDASITDEGLCAAPLEEQE